MNSPLFEESRCLVNFLKKFGVVTKEQAEIICKRADSEEDNLNAKLSYLCRIRAIRFEEDKFVYIQTESSYVPETLYCIWVFLDKIKSKMPVYETNEISSANPCDNGIELCFINKNKLIEYITFVDKASISKVAMIQDTFYTSTGVKRGNESDSLRKYTFVVADEDVMDMLADMNLTIPFEVAFVEGSYAGIPKIEYYGL